ncbi:MAG: universal stress protein [Spirochaetia bacterium]
MLQKILIPLSFHESYEQIEKMCALFKNFGTEEAVLLHVGSKRGGSGRRSREKLESYAEKIRQVGIDTKSTIYPGSVQVEIVRAAGDWEAGYIGFPFKRKNWLKRTILGSVVKDVIRQSEIPVFVFKEKSSRGKEEDEPFRIMYPSSLHWEEDIILSYIENDFFMADEVEFLYVGKRAPDPVVEQKRLDWVEDKLNKMRERVGLSEEKSKSINLLGSPRRVIVKTARRRSVDLILLGKADSVSGVGPVLGSTAEEVSYNASCSVLIIPRDLVPPAARKEGEQ